MIKNYRLLSALAALVLLALWGCAEDGSLMGLCGDGIEDPFEQCDDGNTEDGDGCTAACEIEVDPGLPATLASIQETIFTPICIACHRQGGTAPMSLEDQATSYANLVDAFAYMCSLDRVEPGLPDESCLVLKIEGSPLISGQRMPPPPLPALEQEPIDLIRDWIEDGAEP